MDARDLFKQETHYLDDDNVPSVQAPKKENKTKAGKKLQVVHSRGTGLYKVQFTSGGQLPDWLTGAYTSVTLAQKDIDKYLSEGK